VGKITFKQKRNWNRLKIEKEEEKELYLVLMIFGKRITAHNAFIHN